MIQTYTTPETDIGSPVHSSPWKKAFSFQYQTFVFLDDYTEITQALSFAELYIPTSPHLLIILEGFLSKNLRHCCVRLR